MTNTSAPISADGVRRLYIDGEWIDGDSILEVRDPGTTEIVTRVTQCGAETTRRALEAAQAAFEPWREMTALRRADLLLKMVGEMQRRRSDLARAITLENGKPLPQSYTEVDVSMDHIRWFAEEARRVYGRVIPHQAEGKRHVVIRTPIGVVAAIAPWNFPLMLAVRKVGAGLAAGCPVILRPASQTVSAGLILAECAAAAGLPRGVFQVISGPARAIAGELMSNPICRKLSFTGSTEVGQQLMKQAAQNVTKLSLELGGHAPAIVFDDAPFEIALDALMIAKFRNNGQSCIAANRIFIQDGIYDRFVPALVERVKNLRVGYGFAEDADIGPLVDEAALTHALAQIEDAVRNGARLIHGGRRATPTSAAEHPQTAAGYYLEPTILENVQAGCSCMRDESFAPLIPIARFSTEAEAIAMANDTPFGLAAYIFTTSIGKMWRVGERLDYGMIGINDGVLSTSNAPFGGAKQSGLGRELGSEGILEYTELRHLSFGSVEKLP